jgi:ribosomal protein L37AE/L43A
MHSDTLSTFGGPDDPAPDCPNCETNLYVDRQHVPGQAWRCERCGWQSDYGRA